MDGCEEIKMNNRTEQQMAKSEARNTRGIRRQRETAEEIRDVGGWKGERQDREGGETERFN